MPSTYYWDADAAGGGDGSTGTPFTFDEANAHSLANQDAGNTYLGRNNYEYPGYGTKTLNIYNNFWGAWDNASFGPPGIKTPDSAALIVAQKNGSISNHIIHADAIGGLVRASGCYFNVVNGIQFGDYLLPTSQAGYLYGCYFNAARLWNVRGGGGALDFLFQDCAMPSIPSTTPFTPNNWTGRQCVFTDATPSSYAIQTLEGDNQFGWSMPAAPAWDANKYAYDWADIGTGINTPPQPGIGSPSYSQAVVFVPITYALGMWGTTRTGIGAMTFGAHYTVTYDGNGETSGTPPTDGNLYLTAATVTVLSNSGTLGKTGLTFLGWYTFVNGYKTHYNPGNTFAIGTANIILYADWSFGEKKIRFTGSNDYIEIDMPIWPYSCEIVMPISSIKDAQGTPTFFDPPASHGDNTLGTWDYRILNTATWRIPASQQISLSAFFKDASKGRGENITMTLQSGSGFFPFGPDLGDSGDFVVRLLSQDQLGRLGRPWNHFENDIQLVLVTPPGGYSLPSQVSDGNLSIGSVSGLQYVDYAPKTYRNIQHQLTTSGVPYSIDGRTSGDSYETGFTQICNASKAAALAAFLVSSSGRSSDISIVAPANFYLLGADNGSSGTYTVKFLGASPNNKTVSIKMTHERFNQWSFPLNFWMKVAA